MKVERNEIMSVLEVLAESFQKFLFEDDEIFLENMKTKNLAGDDVSRYQHWEWTQGVGLYGLFQLADELGDEKYISFLKDFYDKEISLGLPAKNINTCAPMLTLAFLLKDKENPVYKKTCHEWAEAIMHDFARTQEGGLQHRTSDSENTEELWDDTLFMTVMFLAMMGEIENNEEYKEEARYQFLLHIKYLVDHKTGLLYHGWTFLDKNNFAEALWGRGNCWFTMAVPEYLAIADVKGADRRFLTEALVQQVKALEKYQDEGGMWHTLVDDPTSYLEASATCGFAYGILKAVRLGLIDKKYQVVGLKALKPILELIDKDGTVNQVSYGTPMGRETKDFYKGIEIKPMPYGQALAMLFLLEVLKANA
ncbi:beta-galactosidase BglB [Butyrivibrio sp. YAB3001]|uniref:beta-galactosidase BglB n=1 Tax=Butyrivibrio sp. YAB3001 TaxID=1520812 RepID=UPI0008F68BBC|nr:glycoside hydrolase family 88 protein [Butyrivibrio sp. YAB3001]SFC31626.1 unsaturated rhamnogalacturonyl hydrolase [Butyrivibrio sp. YAB3001]